MATKRSELEKWVSEFASANCKDCEDNCCNGTRQLINFHKSEVEAINLFWGSGISFYKLADLDKDSVVKWLKEGMYRGLFERKGSNFIGMFIQRKGMLWKNLR